MKPLDPTRTQTLREGYARQLRGHGYSLAADIVKWFETPENWLYDAPTGNGASLPGKPPSDVTANAEGLSQWSFAPVAQVLGAFTRWLNKRTALDDDSKILQDSDGFISKAYSAGDARAADYRLPNDDDSPILEEIQVAFRPGTFIERLKILRTQAREKIKGLSGRMRQRAIDIMSEGMIEGLSPRDVAKRMTSQIRKMTKSEATRIARTEVIRAHAEGTLDRFEAMGIKEVGVNVEWTATRLLDGSFEKRVCPKCRAMDGIIIPIENAHGMIPAHPNCRCAFIPALEKANRDKVRAAVAQAVSPKSKKPRKSKSKKANQSSGSSWPGPAMEDYLKGSKE